MSWIALLYNILNYKYIPVLTFNTLEKLHKFDHYQLLLSSSVAPQYGVAWFENTSYKISFLTFVLSWYVKQHTQAGVLSQE